jgi:hypothetical protein
LEKAKFWDKNEAKRMAEALAAKARIEKSGDQK